MKTVKHTSAFFTVVAVMALLLYLLDSTSVLTLTISSAHPILLLPLLVAVAISAREWVGLVFGCFFGILLDITAVDSYFFNFLVFAVIGCVCGLLSSYMLNDNLYSALLMSLACAVFYFCARWLVFFVLAGRPESFHYLIAYCLPSAVYTALFILPFYYLLKFISRKTRYIS